MIDIAIFCAMVAGLYLVALALSESRRKTDGPAEVVAPYTWFEFIGDLRNQNVSVDEILSRCNGSVPQRPTIYDGWLEIGRVVWNRTHGIGIVAETFLLPSRHVTVKFNRATASVHENDLVPFV